MKQKLRQSHLYRSLIPLLSLALVVLAALYVYFLSRSVLNVVIREEVQQEITALSTSIGELEFQYLALKNQVDVSSAETLGLSPISSKEYAKRYSLMQRALTLNQ